MKDGYSFSANQESLQECYDQEKVAYQNVCDRTRLKALQVVADSGQIGGDTSVEFMALAELASKAWSIAIVAMLQILRQQLQRLT